ncbi:hypothetical protein GE21DRAFT_2627 [Neurospora crassa]|uniref:Uncharacterized protein n=1 Tax=Neurospora crassa (strain ATCC 24698 / 74-OR23-1A / CBS 708.71 / DSM 1257 / FGSC 987) TaxID=367110 RepID=Q7SFI2_NEUCR|nr:hypothetical protein NCU08639 [Neurospora crassa OR74A]EAA35611.1 hypothetical protein NCU08639 [Neurospora crassa OR74A]KHE81211.1 hypothetical protein GE21DRAFT_2627 [Neurospora crassa]|eukprot:XP_964847.1 hypothetical protein NCU08639 [Neurospora crassa OR74A]
MNTPSISSETAVIASAERRRHNIMSAIQSSFGLSNDHILYIINKVIVPEAFDACCNWIRVKRSCGGGCKSELTIDLITNPLTMFDWWVDYNLWAHSFCEYIHQPQFGEPENMAPQYRSFLDTNELRTLEVENAKDKKVAWNIDLSSPEKHDLCESAVEDRIRDGSCSDRRYQHRQFETSSEQTWRSREGGT